MNKTTKYLILFLSILFLAQTNAQTEIALFSRHQLSPGIVDIPRASNIFKPFGFAFEILKDPKKSKLYSLGGGFRISNYSDKNLGRTTEYFVQAKFKFLKFIAEPSKFKIYFGFGPRLVYMQNKNFNPLGDLFSFRARDSGIELPILLNIDYKLGERWNFHFNMNTISLAFFYDHQFSSNPGLSDNARTNSGFDFDGTFLNELRIGVGYIVSRE